MTTFRTHDFDKRIEIVATSGMYRYTCRLVDDDHIIVFVNYSNRCRGHGGLMTVQGMRYHIAVLDDVLDSWHSVAIDDDIASLYSVFLKRLSLRVLQGKERHTYIVSLRSITKLGSKDVKQFPPAPSLFTVSIVRIVIRMNLSEVVFQVVRPRPRITRSGDNVWRRAKCFWIFCSTAPFVCKCLQWLQNGQCHIPCSQPTRPRKERGDAR